MHVRTRALSVTTIAVLVAACHRNPGHPSFAPVACGVSAPSAPVKGEEAVVSGTATFDSAWAIIGRSHWDTTFNGVNWPAVRDTIRPKAARARTAAELRATLTEMLATLRQSHFSIIPQTSARPSATTDLSGDLGLTIRDANPEVLVTGVRAGGPGALAGVRSGYAVVAIDGCPLPARGAFASGSDERHLKLDRWRDAAMKLRGPVGTEVSLSLRTKDGGVSTFRMVRAAEPGELTKVGNLPAMTASLSTSRQVSNGRTIGIIKFNIWMPVLSQAIASAVDSLRGADAIVLDLRGNLGGFGLMSAGIAGHFTDTSLTLGTMLQRGGVQNYVINPQRVNPSNQRVKPYAGPLAIVVDELSISTTEIFAAGMQALGRARIFGVQTAGQALPSVAEELPNGDVLYHAVANFLSPTGAPIEGGGVRPDVEVPLSRAALLSGRDPALDAAINWAASSDGKSLSRSRRKP